MKQYKNPNDIRLGLNAGKLHGLMRMLEMAKKYNLPDFEIEILESRIEDCQERVDHFNQIVEETA